MLVIWGWECNCLLDLPPHLFHKCGFLVDTRMRGPCLFGFGHITELYIRKTFNHEDGLLECFAATFLFNWGYKILAPCFGFLRV